MSSALMHSIQHLHFVGVGGAGMSALAEITRRQGFVVSGSDQQRSAITDRLQTLGVQVHVGHAASHIAGAQALVTSTAVKADNPEVMAALEKNLPVVPRAVLLGELMRTKTGVAVAGTHGKTTTTSLMASVLMAAGVDPSFVIGGTLHSLGANARLGQGEHFVAEADESDASFLQLHAVVAVITNIDRDHMETYGHSQAQLHTAFVDFIQRLPFFGRAVLCADDAGVQAILPRLQRAVTTYGLKPGADLQAVQVVALAGACMQFVARQTGHDDLALTLPLAGLHNVNNALAVLAVARHLGVADSDTARGLREFAGVGRRFELMGELPADSGGHYTLIDDYGHHPVEVAAVIAAARGAFVGRRLVVAFQPHRYTRTRDCLAEFAQALAMADALLITEVYSAGETAIAGADGAALAQRIRGDSPSVQPVQFVPDLAALPLAIQAIAGDGDVVITLGAGSIGAVPAQLLKLHPVSL